MNQRDQGFTLIEMLAALTITAFISLFLVQVTKQATDSISKISDSAVTVQSAIRFSNLIKYDFSGSQDVYVHSNTQPVQGNNKSCTTFDPSISVWGNPTGLNKYIRGLFSLRVAEVNYNSTSSDSPKWQQLTPRWIGYEIRQNSYAAGKIMAPSFELWRVVCDDVAGSPAKPTLSKSEDVLDLGNVLSPLVLADMYVKCFDDVPNTSGSVTTNQIDCRSGASAGYDVPTASRTDYYRFELPYSGSKSILKTLKQNELQVLRRRIDN